MNPLLYLTAHAPAEPQPWFKPIMHTERPATLWVSEDGLRKYLDRHAAERAEGEYYRNSSEQAQSEWDREYNRQRLIQWPRAWAHAVLAGFRAEELAP